MVLQDFDNIQNATVSKGYYNEIPVMKFKYHFVTNAEHSIVNE